MNELSLVMDTEFPRGRDGPRRKIMKVPGGGEYPETPWNRKSWGVGVKLEKKTSWEYE